MHPRHDTPPGHGPDHGPHRHGRHGHGHHGPHHHGRGRRHGPHGRGPRRPLRVLARRLGLEAAQLTTVAGILEDLSTERAQAEVDRRRAAKLYAEALAGETFDAEKAEAAGRDTLASATRLQAARASALSQLHAVLTPEQRAKAGVLLRSGPLDW